MAEKWEEKAWEVVDSYFGKEAGNAMLARLIAKSLRAAHAEGKTEGRREALEEAAKEAENSRYRNPKNDWQAGGDWSAWHIAQRIRALKDAQGQATPAPPCKQVEHIESKDCWCEPELVYEDPETGAQVWLHTEIH